VAEEEVYWENRNRLTSWPDNAKNLYYLRDIPKMRKWKTENLIRFLTGFHNSPAAECRVRVRGCRKSAALSEVRKLE